MDVECLPIQAIQSDITVAMNDLEIRYPCTPPRWKLKAKTTVYRQKWLIAPVDEAHNTRNLGHAFFAAQHLRRVSEFKVAMTAQTPTQSSIGNENNTMCYTIQIEFHIIYCPITCSIPNLIFFTISFDDCQNLQWRLGLVWLWRQKRLPIALWACGKLVHKCLLELVCLSGVTNLYIMC